MALPAESRASDEGPSDGAFSLSDELTVTDLSHQVAVEAGIQEDQAETAVRVVQQRSFRIGPYPSASEIARYNEIEPGLGTRLVEDFLAQREQSMRLNDRIVAIAEKDSEREDGWLQYARGGQRLGFAATLLLLASSVLCAFFLHEYWLAAAFIAAPAIGVVAQFIHGANR